MICPACKNNMIVVEYKRIELDYCTHCHGVWFDTGELDLLLESAELNEIPMENIQDSPEATTTEARRNCPICRKSMNKVHVGKQPPILIDVCRNGDGLFFDGGEINNLIGQFNTQTQQQPVDKNPVIDFLGEVFKGQ